MNREELFSHLNTPPLFTSENRRVLVAFLKDQASIITAHPELTTRIAYGIAGILATDFARNLPEDDPVDEILTIAGELEVAPEDTKSLRSELIEKINMLESE